MILLFLLSLFFYSTLSAATPSFLPGERVAGNELKCTFRFTLGDLNGDGRQDITVMSHGRDRCWVHYNQGTAEEPKFTFAQRLLNNFSENVPSWFYAAGSMQLTDWDNDGDNDFLMSDANGWSPGTEGVYLVTNIGSAASYRLYPGHKLLPIPGTRWAHAVDWDKDGKKDLLVATTRKLSLHLNNRGNDTLATFDLAKTFKTALLDSLPCSGLASADFNNDGRLDLLTFAAGTRASLYYATAKPESLEAGVRLDSIVNSHDLSAFDWNRDGLTDILVMDTIESALLLHINAGSATTPLFHYRPDTIRATDFARIEQSMYIQVADWDRDGHNDLMFSGGYDVHCSGMTPYIRFYRNLSPSGMPLYGTGQFLKSGGKVIGGSWGANGMQSAVVADFTGDAVLDAYSGWTYATSNQQNVKFFKGSADSLATASFAKDSLCNFGLLKDAQYWCSAVTDWDNDGDKDLVIANARPYPHPADLYLYHNMGNSTTPVFSDSNRTLLFAFEYSKEGTSVMPFVTDMNNDNKKDLLLSTDKGLRFYANIGEDSAPQFNGYEIVKLMGTNDSLAMPGTYPGYVPVTDLRHGPVFKGAPVVTDVNRDGTPDLLMAYTYFTGSYSLTASELWLFLGVSNGTNHEKSVDIDKHLSALSIAPNPFNPYTTISLQSGFKGNGVLKIFNMQGQQVYTCSKPGLKHLWNAKGSAAGFYNVRYTEQGKSRSLRILLTR
ncbi:MAG: T9SS type A sorting domain-containing protein [Fibrobacteres bacterium]|nr:T9SS type A sorting domain-containing protein [Fibrobacterota bacterium]